jgi:signal transduction histidine kinase
MPLFPGPWWELLAWVAALVVLNMLEIPAWRGHSLAPTEPIALATCVLFPPATAALMALLGSSGRREFSGRSELIRSISNRGQIAAGILIASIAVQPILGERANPLMVVIAVVVAWIIWAVENYLAVAVGLAVYQRIPAGVALRELRLATLFDYGITVVTWCLMAAGLVFAYRLVGLWALLALLVPVVVVGRALAKSDSLERIRHQVDEQRRTLLALSQRIASERRDERLRIAGDLHDEIIQPMFQVSLLSHVLERDLAEGNLSELQTDIVQLRSSADLALGTLRDVVHGLRVSPLGPKGLGPAVRAVARDLAERGVVDVHCTVEELGNLPQEIELVVYQCAREAMTNAVAHSRASRVDATLSLGDGGILLLVADDGSGFDTRERVDNHFGLLIMAERVESVGGSLFVDSIPSQGTRVTAYFPLDRSAHTPE